MRLFVVLGALACTLVLPSFATGGRMGHCRLRALTRRHGSGRDVEADDLRQAARRHAPRRFAARRHDRGDRVWHVDEVPRHVRLRGGRVRGERRVPVHGHLVRTHPQRLRRLAGDLWTGRDRAERLGWRRPAASARRARCGGDCAARCLCASRRATISPLDSGERLSQREPTCRSRCRNGRWRTGRRATPCSPNARETVTSAHSRSSCTPTRASLSAPPTC